MLIASIQSAPAETTLYMIAGYSVIFSVMLIYIVSLILRNRDLKRNWHILKDLEEKDR